MTATDHPGPWAVDERDEEFGTPVVDARGKVVVAVLMAEAPGNEPVVAELIADAPKMLKLLRMAEWKGCEQGGSSPCCPFCEAAPPGPHVDVCELGALLERHPDAI